MTNIVPLDKSRGFTRMDNQLMDSLMAIDLSARELKIVLYVAKATINFGAGAQRIPATAIAKATHIHPDTVSKAISGLLRRRVLFRDGGARGDIGVCDPKEWVYSSEPKQTKPSDSAQIVRIGSAAKQTKIDDSLLYSKKQTPYVNLPSEDVTCPPKDQPATGNEPQADRKPAFGKSQMLADNPHGLDESLITDYLAVRKAKRAPVSARVWSTLNAKLGQCAAFGVTPAQAMAIAIENGWQGFEVEWITKRSAARLPAAPASRHTGFADRDYTAGLTQREDGSYAL
ncbi:replication protein [Pseudomonas sp. 21LCFQ010]|uniref:replication protein n=1 Tax=Pseudomonas sp. 21LCFQ010 TaxID=2957506 RepID=UPI0020981EDA|nr:replication protein [Pseudomonas sp. 21LCFQ010]MCO8161046.1 replication protein [Pseudomonas sp. 21LCFQ010]